MDLSLLLRDDLSTISGGIVSLQFRKGLCLFLLLFPFAGAEHVVCSLCLQLEEGGEDKVREITRSKTGGIEPVAGVRQPVWQTGLVVPGDCDSR